MKNKAINIKQVPPDKGHYIAGFVDGEGSFYVSARRRDDYRSKWRMTAHFNISNNDLKILEICRKYLGCGSIRQSRKGFYTLEVENLNNLNIFIIPFFRRFVFLSSKKTKEFSTFRKAVALIEAPIQTQAQLELFFQLRKELNELRKGGRATNTDAVILESFIFKEESSETIR
jgi:hypothetical protein